MENKLMRKIRLIIFGQRTILHELGSVLPKGKKKALKKKLSVSDVIDEVTDTTDYKWHNIYTELKFGYRRMFYNKVRVGHEVYYYVDR